MLLKSPKIIDLNFLSKVINSINKAKDFQSISEIIFDFIEELIPFNMAVIYGINENQKELKVVSCRGSDVNKMKERIPFKIGKGAVGWVAKEKKALLIHDALASEGIRVRQFFNEDPLIRSFLAVPLIVGDNLVEILSVSCSKPYQYKEYDVEMITIIASQGAALLELNNRINEAERFSNHILENINSGVMVIDNNYRVILFNKAAEKISGYNRNEVLGISVIDFPLKENKEDWHIIESLESEKIFFEKPAFIIRKDGVRVSVVLSTSILIDDKGNKKGCICIFRDNTEIEKLQQQIMRAEKLAAIGRLTAGLAHEIRNPLLPIRTSAQLLLKRMDKYGENSDVVKLINIIYEESERLNRFLNRFIDLSKSDANVKDKTLFKETVDEILALMAHDFKKNKIKVDIKSSENLYLPFSKDQLKQIFLNLFLNSIDALNNKSQNEQKIIEIITTVEDDKAVIEFKDTGEGISKEEINKIFDPFYTTKENGTGLGLSIVYKLINGVKGKIIVDSSRGKGTKFTIVIPLIDM